MNDVSAVHSRRQFLAALAAAAALPTIGHARTASAAHPAVRALIDRYVGEKKVAGMVVAIGTRTGPPQFLAGGTLAFTSTAQAGPDTLFRIYSMTKPITACAVMMLVEDGKLGLDQPVSEVFPAYARMNVLTDPANSLATRPATRPILIRHLLTHSAGLSYTITGTGPIHKLYAEKGIVPAQTSLQDEATMHRPAKLIAFAEAVASLPLLVEPGTAWNYSISLDVAGAVVEKVSGEPFDRFLQRRILTPLGMKDSGFMVPAAKIGRLATNYTITPQGLVPLDPPPRSIYAAMPAFPYGGAGLVSSARDYARFMAMLLGEGQIGNSRLMKTETARLMMSCLLEPGVMAMGDSGYGAGGRVVLAAKPAGEAAGTYGWSGAAGTTAFVDRTNGVYAVLMTQFMPSQSYPLNADFGAAFYRDLAAA
jgi:CubicO group peptidase (beta-lactamase class C family)